MLMDELEKIKLYLRYNPKTRNVKKSVDKCIYGRKSCYYYYNTFRLDIDKCPFSNQTYCHRYLSERCCQWQLLYNKRRTKWVKLTQ